MTKFVKQIHAILSSMDNPDDEIAAVVEALQERADDACTSGDEEAEDQFTSMADALEEASTNYTRG